MYIIDQIDLPGDKHGIVKIIVYNTANGYLLCVMSLPHFTEVQAPIDHDDIIHITESLFEQSAVPQPVPPGGLEPPELAGRCAAWRKNRYRQHAAERN